MAQLPQPVPKPLKPSAPLRSSLHTPSQRRSNPPPQRLRFSWSFRINRSVIPSSAPFQRRSISRVQCASPEVSGVDHQLHLIVLMCRGVAPVEAAVITVWLSMTATWFGCSHRSSAQLGFSRMLRGPEPLDEPISLLRLRLDTFWATNGYLPVKAWLAPPVRCSQDARTTAGSSAVLRP